MAYSSLLEILEKNAALTRRQACRVGGILGLCFSTFGPFRTRLAFAKKRKSLKEDKPMKLSPPILDGNISVEKAIKQRRTVRSFTAKSLTAQQFSQILWAAQGITEDGGFKRAAPSGGALYPADVYAVTGKNSVEDLPGGTYHYHPANHFIEKIAEGDKRDRIATASFGQMWMASAAVLFVVTAEYRRITMKYGDRGIRYAVIEAGHIGQNIFLQCQALGLTAGIVGAFYDKDVAKAINAGKNHEPLIIMPVGWKG
ncbi:MAG: SagB/ThcOx family dehydrogenase [Desulfobacterales bacterium]|nr:SagB/ThcOx family dehydrogenase [Desulfobacterales bacterium]